MNTPIKVVLPSNDQPVTSSESSQQSMDSKHDIETSQDGTEKIVITQPYGSMMLMLEQRE